MREAGTGLKSAWRGQITGAGLGTRLANSIRSASFGKALEPARAIMASAQNTATTIVAPLTTSVIWRPTATFCAAQ